MHVCTMQNCHVDTCALKNHASLEWSVTVIAVLQRLCISTTV